MYCCQLPRRSASLPMAAPATRTKRSRSPWHAVLASRSFNRTPRSMPGHGAGRSSASIWHPLGTPEAMVRRGCIGSARPASCGSEPTIRAVRAAAPICRGRRCQRPSSPVLWRGAFQAKQGETPRQTVARCYPHLIAARRQSYAALAHATLQVAVLRELPHTADAFLELLPQQFLPQRAGGLK